MAAPTDADLLDSIKDILKSADLASLSSKKVRKELEAKFEMELASRKKDIDDMLMAELAKATAPPANGASASHSDSDEGPEDSEPIRKKKKAAAASTSSDSEGLSGDEAVARKLHKAENGARRARSGAAKPSAEKKPKRKGPKAGTSIYSQECLLSEELAKVLGVPKMARKDVVSAMWKIFKERGLQDPKNKQFVLCDEDLFPVFKTKRFKAFGMMKFLKTHIKDAHFVADQEAAAS